MKRIIIAAALLLFLPLYGSENEILYEQGIEAFNSGNYGSAELIFKKLIDERNHELRDRAWFHLARSIYQQKKYKAAVFEFNKFLNDCRTPSLAIESRFWIAEAYFNQKEFIKAIEEYKRFINQSRDRDMNALSHNRIAAIYYSQGRYDEAVLEWDKSVSFTADPVKNAQWILNIGRAHFHNRKYDEAVQRLNPLLTSRADPRIVALARIIISEINQISDNHRGALLILNGIPDSLLKEPQINSGVYLKARSHLALGNTAVAKNYLNIYLHTGRDSEYYYHALLDSAIISIEQNETEKGIESLEIVRKNSPDKNLKARASRDLSRLYIKSDPLKAIPYLEESLSADAGSVDDREALLLLSRAYINMGDHLRAEQSLQNILSKYPFDSNIDEVYFLLGRVYLVSGDYGKSEENFNNIKRNSPFSKRLKEIPYYEGQIFFKNEKYPETVRSLSTYLAKRNIEFSYEARVLLHSSYLMLNDRRNADRIINDIQRLHRNADKADEVLLSHAEFHIRIKGTPDTYLTNIIRQYSNTRSEARSLLLLGKINNNQGKDARAVEYLLKYLNSEFAENKIEAYPFLISSLTKLKKYEAVIEYDSKIDISSYDAETMIKLTEQLAEARFRTKDYDGAYDLLETVHTGELTPAAALIYVETAVRTGNPNRADTAVLSLKNGNRLYGDALILFAETCSEVSNIECAERAYSQFLEEVGTHPARDRAAAGLAGIHLQKGDYAEAVKLASDVKGTSLKPEASAIIILADFYSDREAEAAAASRKIIFHLMKTRYAEKILYLNSEYSRKTNNLLNFQFYSSHLKKYPGYESYILYNTADMNYSRGNYRTSLPPYTKLAAEEGPYRNLSAFKSAGIQLHINRNIDAAEKVFMDIYETPDIDIVLKNRSAMELVLIYRESGRTEDEKRILDANRSPEVRDLYSVQMTNLAETPEPEGDEIK